MLVAHGAQASPSASTHPHGDVDFEKEYKIRAIVGELKNKYQIDWEDDSDTGESYPKTWEPKKNANALAVADWERKKAAKVKKRRLPCAVFHCQANFYQPHEEQPT